MWTMLRSFTGYGQQTPAPKEPTGPDTSSMPPSPSGHRLESAPVSSPPEDRRPDGVYVGKRPIATAGMTLARGVAKLGGDHQWLVVDKDGKRTEMGMGNAEGGVPDGKGDSPFVTQTTVNDHTGQSMHPDSTLVPAHEYHPDYRGVTPDQVLANIRPGEKLGTWTPTNQCHTYVHNTLTSSLPPEKQEAIRARTQDSVDFATGQGRYGFMGPW